MQEPILRIGREVPLWSIVSGLAVIVVQAVGLYVNQINLTNTIAVQADSIHTLSAQYAKLSTDVSTLGTSGLESKLKLEEMNRRLSILETERMATRDGGKR